MLNFLKKKDPSIDDLIREFHRIGKRMKELGDDASKARTAALSDNDIGKLDKALRLVDLELSVCQEGQFSIRNQMAEIFTKNRVDELKNLEARKKTYEAEFNRVSHEAGSLVGKVLIICENAKVGYFSKLASHLRDSVASATSHEDGENFLKSMRAATYDVDGFNFMEEKRAISKAKTLDPKSEGGQLSIRKKINRFLNPNAAFLDQDGNEIRTNQMPFGPLGVDPSGMAAAGRAAKRG